MNPQSVLFSFDVVFNIKSELVVPCLQWSISCGTSRKENVMDTVMAMFLKIYAIKTSLLCRQYKETDSFIGSLGVGKHETTFRCTCSDLLAMHMLYQDIFQIMHDKKKRQRQQDSIIDEAKTRNRMFPNLTLLSMDAMWNGSS